MIGYEKSGIRNVGSGDAAGSRKRFAPACMIDNHLAIGAQAIMKSHEECDIPTAIPLLDGKMLVHALVAA